MGLVLASQDGRVGTVVLQFVGMDLTDLSVSASATVMRKIHRHVML